jgi:hypothetical protein
VHTEPHDTLHRSDLAARVRRLLLVHPRWHRRLHAADMVTSVLDAAADGRPFTRRAAIALIADGLRCRLQVRGGAARVFAALAALAGSGVLAASAGWGAWQVSAAPWPSAARAAVLAAPVLPAATPRTVSRVDTVMGGTTDVVDRILIPLIGDPEPGAGGVTRSYVLPAVADPAAARAEIVARLQAAGWRTSTDGTEVVGDRAGMRISVLLAAREAGTDDLVIGVRPAPPAIAGTAAVAGAALGALAGWLIAAAAVARNLRRAPRSRALTRVLGTAGVLLLVPAAALSLVTLADGGPPPWFGFGVFGARPLAAAGVVLALTAWRRSHDTGPAAPAAVTVGPQPA